MGKLEIINLLKDCDAIQFGRFILTSGAVSNYYIDIKKASTNPTILKKIVEAMADHIKDNNLIAGMELGAVPLVVALSLKTNIPYVIVRKEKREHGTSKQIEGVEINGKRVLIIEDVTTSGGSVVKTIKIIRENKGIVDEVIAIVDRESGAEEKLRNVDVSFIPLISAFCVALYVLFTGPLAGAPRVMTAVALADAFLATAVFDQTKELPKDPNHPLLKLFSDFSEQLKVAWDKPAELQKM